MTRILGITIAADNNAAPAIKAATGDLREFDAATQKASEQVERLAAQRSNLKLLATAYQDLAESATKGSDVQVIAAQKAADAQKRLADQVKASNAEIAVSSAKTKEASLGLGQIGSSAKSAEGMVSKLSGSMALWLGAPALGAGLASAIHGTQQFSAAMELLHTQAGASQAEVKRMTTALQGMASQVGTGPAELVDEFIGQHAAEDSTIASLRKRLRYATEGPKLDGKGGWGDVRIDRIQPAEIGAWRKRLPERSAFGIVKSLRQVLHYAVRAKLLDENPAALITNPEPKRGEVPTFTLDELDAIGSEMLAAYRAIPVFAALTGLRPCEWIALERRDVDRKAGTVAVRREYVDGRVKLYGKTSRSLRVVPLPQRASEALAGHPARLDTPLLFPASRGGHIDLQAWRWREWNTAVRAAGIQARVPYAMRHTYASLSIAAGVNLFEVARFMGTSVTMIEKTYGHLLPDALERTRSALDSFLSPQSVRERSETIDSDEAEASSEMA